MNNEARELELYIANTYASWHRVEALARNYERKRAKGTYDSALAAKGFAHIVHEAAHNYSREHSTGRDGMSLFPKAVRDEVCLTLRDYLEAEWKAGNYWGDAPSQAA